MADLEARLLLQCASWKILHGYVQKRLDALTGRAIAPLIQASLLEHFARLSPTMYPLWKDTAGDLLQNYVLSWFHTLARTDRSFETHTSVWQWIVRLASGSIDIPAPESPNGTRLSVARCGLVPILYQWTPLASGGTAGRHEERMITALVSYITESFRLPENSRWPCIPENLARIIKPWNIWIRPPSVSRNHNIKTLLFIYVGAISTASLKICQGHHCGPRGGRYRLSYVEGPTDEWASPKLLFSVNIDPSIELWDGPELIIGELHRDPLQMAKLAPGKLDVLVDAVRQSMELDEDQKDCMIEGIRAFPTT